MRPLVLAILDGWGHSEQKHGNAIANAKTPTIDTIRRNFPAITLQASSSSVGLAWGEPGNSEVGHLTIGAGRTVFQYATRIAKAIESGEFFKNPALMIAVEHSLKNNASLHIAGLFGSGSVHSSFDHLIALLKLAKQAGIQKLYLHLFADGKDSGLKEFPSHLAKLQKEMQTIGIGTIATVIGRNDAMDRDNNWDKTERTFRLLVEGKGEMATDLNAQMQSYYQKGLDDSGLPPTLVDPSGIIKEGDSLIFFNFREDSMRQIARSFIDPSLNAFTRTIPGDLAVVMMTQYFEDPGLNLHVAFPLPTVQNGLAEVLSASGLKQLHIAETEKYAHATYFFNCLHNIPFAGEEDVLIESRKDHSPELKADEIAQKCADELAKDAHDFTILNLANADVLSHMGNLEDTVKGVEYVDAAVAKIYEAVRAKDGILVITADHGNAESLLYKGTGDAETKHDLNPVPFYLIGREFQREKTEQEVLAAMERPKGLISDVAPTILDLMKIQAPAEMTGASLLHLLS